MIFNEHSKLAGTHAFLSASNNAWVNYDEDKIKQVFKTSQAASRGTKLHAFAHDAIRLGIQLPPDTTLGAYVNDVIEFEMFPEQVLFYSINAYGTADAIRYWENEQLLRIFDLKTGVGKVSERQLEIYTSFFCLEYGIRPFDIKMDLRFYQNDEVLMYTPNPSDILSIMDKIVWFDNLIEEARLEEQA